MVSLGLSFLSFYFIWIVNVINLDWLSLVGDCVSDKEYKLFSTFELDDREEDYLSDKFEFEYWDGDGDIPKEKLKEKIRDVDVLLCYFMNDIDAEIMDSGKELKVISTRTAGYNHIDVDEANKRDIKVTKVSGPIAEGVAETTVGLILSLIRGIHPGNNHIEKGDWNDLKEVWSNQWGLTLLQKKNIGLIGMGAIGKRLTELLNPYQATIYYYNRSRKEEIEKEYDANFLEFDELIPKVDILVSAIPLTDETKHMFDSKTFERMKKESIFINISRGGVVNTDHLVKALKQDQIKKAAVDVYEQEPLPQNHKLHNIDSNNLLKTPHIGGISKETSKYAKVEAAKNAYKVLQGKKIEDLVN